MVDVYELVEQMEETGVLEDRREYDVEDLKKCYGLTDQEAADLHYLVQRTFDPDRKSAYECDPTRLGITIRESLHQGLDGWSSHEQVIIEKYLDDIALAVAAE